MDEGMEPVLALMRNKATGEMDWSMPDEVKQPEPRELIANLRRLANWLEKSLKKEGPKKLVNPKVTAADASLLNLLKSRRGLTAGG